MHVERRQLSGAREWIDDAPRVSAAVLAELRAWAGAEDAAESKRKSVRGENLDSALRASTSALRASRLEEGVRAESNVCMPAARESVMPRRGLGHWTRQARRTRRDQPGGGRCSAGRVGQTHDASASGCRRDRKPTGFTGAGE